MMIRIGFIPAWGQPSAPPEPQTEDNPGSGRFHLEIEPRNFEPELLESALLASTNQERIQRGLPPLIRNDRLAQSARRYSEDMRRRQKISHVSPTYGLETLPARLEQAGIAPVNASVAENLAVDYCLVISGIPFYLENRSGTERYMDARTRKPVRPYTYHAFARQVVDRWIQSPGHRENLLNPGFQRIGIGVSAGRYRGLDAIYVTQHFWGGFEDHQEP